MGCHSENGISYSENGISISESYSEDTPGTRRELREWPFHTKSVFPEIGVVPLCPNSENVNSVQIARGIVKTSGFTRGVCKRR